MLQSILNQVLLWDCREILKSIPDNSIDLIFADPPYFLQLPWNGKRLKRANGTEVIPVEDDRDKFTDYQEYDQFCLDRLKECQRVLKPTGSMWVIWMYHNIFRVGKIMQDLWIRFLNDVIRIKKDALPNMNGRRMTNNHETIIWWVKDKTCKKYTYNYDLMKQLNWWVQLKDTDWSFGVCRWNERLKDENGIKVHPTQKPFKLIQQIILASSNEWDIVLDPFFWTGTTWFVAKALKRNRIWIEKSEKYVKISYDRITK